MATSEANPGLMRSLTISDDMIDNLGILGRDFLGGNHPNSVLTQEGLTILLVKGSIADQLVGAIVNSVGGNFDLRQGALSRSILEKAGLKMQESLTGLRPTVLRYGEVTTTNGFALPASFVFHGVLKQWNNGKDNSEDTLRNFIRNCLLEADKRRLGSIAIPAVGSGILGYPSDLVVDCLFNEADKFSESNPNTTVNEIRFVIYEKDQKTFDAFEAKLNQIKPDDNGNKSEDDVQSSSDSSSDDESPRNQLTFSQHIRGLNQMANESAVTFRQIGTAFPLTWNPTPPGKQYGTTILTSSDSEFKMVSKRVMETKGTTPMQNILKIERIENRTMYQLCTVYKNGMEQRNGNQVENERILWHGTVKESITNICSGGFNRSYCGKNATVYGQGVYFARDFSYSAQTQYSRPDTAGTKYIFMCKVLTGTFSVGNDKMIEPEMKPGTDFRHDSTVNDLNDPSIFVIFKDAQAYPEYLVAFN